MLSEFTSRCLGLSYSFVPIFIPRDQNNLKKVPKGGDQRENTQSLSRKMAEALEKIWKSNEDENGNSVKINVV